MPEPCKSMAIMLNCDCNFFFLDSLIDSNTDKDLVSCVGWTTADELFSSG